MKPLGKGAKRTALAENISEIDTELRNEDNRTTVLAAILGGAIEETLRQTVPASPEQLKDEIKIFWRLFNENTWRLTRALKASNLIKEIK